MAMEGYSYAPSYPDSGHSSPRSRDIDYENSSSWEDPMNPQTAPAAYKVKFMCSYGGKILPRPYDNQLSYIGGETKIISVDRNIKFSALLAKLSSFCDFDSVSFKYQLPGEDLDALISVTNDEDLENLMQEYDRLYKLSPKPARLRLFLFGANPPCHPTPSNSSVGTRSFGSDDGVTTRSEKERFVEALNSVTPPPQAVVAPPPIPAGNVDFLFGLEKGIANIAPSPPPLQQQHLQPPVVMIGRASDSPQTVDQPPMQEPGYPIQKHIQDLQRLTIEEHHQAMYRKKNDKDDVVTGGFPIHGAGDYYFPNLQENVSKMNVPANISMQPGAGYWTEKHVPGGFPGTDHLYMIQTPQGAYGHPQMMKQVTGPTTQGYYTLQNIPPDQSYSNHQIPYNMKPVAQPPPPPLQSQPPAKQTTAYSEGYGIVQPGGGGGGGGYGYAQVAYDNNGIGKQVYYTAHGGGVMAPPPPTPQQQVAAQYNQTIATTGEVKALEAVRVVGKATQGSV